MAYLLGIDIGTSACKAALFDLRGKPIAQESADYPVHYPREGWAEQNPTDWWSGTVAALRRLLAGRNARDILAIGVDGQSWSAVLVDAAGDVLCNTPIWMDTRAQAECAEIERAVGRDALFALSGNSVQPAYTLPKMLWYQHHLPDAYRRARCVLQSNSYIIYKLTGAITQDLSQGYGLQCFDMRARRWNTDILRTLGLRGDLLPELFPCHQVVGHVTEDAAKATGILSGTPVVAGGLDAACGTLGAGVYRAGKTQEQGGQAGGMSICIDEYAADPRLILSCHVVPDRWLLQGGTVGGGGVLRWMGEQLGAQDRLDAQAQGIGLYDAMSGQAARIAPGSDGLIFLPYMAGERSPLWNPHAKGVFYGLDFTKTRGHMIRAAMEGVAYSLRHNLEAARTAGASVGTMHAMGGSANSLIWTQLKADITGYPIDVPSSDTATALGAALLAGVGVGAYSGFDEAVNAAVRLRRSHQPNPENRAVYDAGYAQYRRIYEALKYEMEGTPE